MISVTSDIARQVAEWINKRGGVALWRSVNLSMPDREWITPIDAPRPSWMAGEQPAEVARHIKDVEVKVVRDAKKIRVYLDRKHHGMKILLTAASTKRLRKWLDKFHPSSYRFEADMFGNPIAVIYRIERTIPLDEFIHS